REAAEKMVADGGHFWNAGMFVWRVEEVIKAYEQHLPATAKAIGAIREAIGSPRYQAVLAEVWAETDRPTPDYGTAEKRSNACHGSSAKSGGICARPGIEPGRPATAEGPQGQGPLGA